MDSAPASTGQTERVARVAMMQHLWADRAPTTGFAPLSWKTRLLFVALAAGSFHIAYAFPPLAFVIVGWLYGLFRLSEVGTARQAFWIGAVAALAAFVPHVAWFWTLFKFGAIALWMVLAFWIGLFVVVVRFVREQLGFKAACLLAPFVWTGFEFFRSELYPLRFSWLIPGYAFSESGANPVHWPLGMYGFGFVTIGLVAWFSTQARTVALVANGLLITLLAFLANHPQDTSVRHPVKLRSVSVAGVQLEMKHDLEVLEALKLAREKHPTIELFVLSELSFDGPVSARVRDWCRRERVHLIAGGKELLGDRGFFNTAYVINPDGEVVFKQVKSRPVQFMDDGLPATEQRVWDSPWGKIGICICYDLSFTRVTDGLIRQGAKALIVPTMDAEHWGAYQHRLHARVAPVRAAEYGVPIFRVASSGISQMVEPEGHVTATAPFPGQHESLAATLNLRWSPARTPLDRYLVWPCVAVAFGLLGWHVVEGLRSRFNPSRSRGTIHNLQ